MALPHLSKQMRYLPHAAYSIDVHHMEAMDELRKKIVQNRLNPRRQDIEAYTLAQEISQQRQAHAYVQAGNVQGVLIAEKSILVKSLRLAIAWTS